MSYDGSTIARPRRGRLWLFMFVSSVLAAAATGWAASVVLMPAKDVLDSSLFATVKVVEGKVGSTIALNTVANWVPVPVGSNQATGVVTTVNIVAGTNATQGMTLYTVNMRPVVVARGLVPAYQPIALGSKGNDVSQLQAMLTELDFYHGAVDGEVGGRTVSAIKAWQNELGLEETGFVNLGDVIFIPTIPGRISLDTEVIARSASVAGGEPVVAGLPSTPVFTMPVSVSQASMMPTGTRVMITAPDLTSTWNAYVVDQAADDTSDLIQVSLEGEDGSVICAAQCSELPVVGQSLLSSSIVTIEPVSGLVVPSSAILSKADGTLAVVDIKGLNHPVTQLTSAKGMSVVEGVSEGLRVRVPASTRSD